MEREYKDAIHVTTTVRLSRMDRIRVLFGWDVMVSTRTPTAEVVGAGRSSSSAWCAPPPWWPKFGKQEGATSMGAEEDPDWVLVREIMER